MKQWNSCLIALALLAAMAPGALRPNIAPCPALHETAATAHRAFPAAKDQADSILGDVHAYSCYITTVRCIAAEPSAGSAFIIYRNAAGTSVNYMGTADNGASWTLIPALNTFTSARYPSAMADPVDHKPWAFFNTGMPASPDKGLYFTYDAAGYNGGLWNTEGRIDSLGAGSGTNGIYVATGHRGTNGVVHCVANYWGASTPDAALYYRSTDGGATWNLAAPRYPANLLMYTTEGTSDSISLFGAGNPVVHDSLTAGFINQVALWGSVTGDTLMIGSCGCDTLADTSNPLSSMRYWYRLSYDAGLTWTPLTWGPELNYVAWIDPCYDLDIALDRDGYPHFGGFLYLDTAATAPFGPNSGIYDTYLTASGWQQTKVYPVDTLGDNIPRFANYGMDADGNLYMSFANNAEGALSNMNIFLAGSNDNGATWSTNPFQVTTDGAGYDYPHLPRDCFPDTLIGCLYIPRGPVWYQRGAAGFVYRIPPDGVNGSPTTLDARMFSLGHCRPNPVSSHATISFTLPQAAAYSLRVYNIAGQLVKDLSGRANAGHNTVPLNVRGLANGVFFYKLQAGGNSATGRMMVVR